jgi:hypothetical protein
MSELNIRDAIIYRDYCKAFTDIILRGWVIMFRSYGRFSRCKLLLSWNSELVAFNTIFMKIVERISQIQCPVDR